MLERSVLPVRLPIGTEGQALQFDFPDPLDRGRWSVVVGLLAAAGCAGVAPSTNLPDSVARCEDLAVARRLDASHLPEGLVHSRRVSAMAVTANCPAVLASLLEAGADPRATDDWGLELIHLAAQAGHDEIVELLLEAGVPADATPQPGQRAVPSTRPLHLAAAAGREGVVRVLVDAGAELDALASPHRYVNRSAGSNEVQTGVTPLVAAASSGALAVVRALVDEGANLHDRRSVYVAPDIEGQEGPQLPGLTALAAAAWRGHADVVDFLISEGADVDAQAGVSVPLAGGGVVVESGHTPLAFAALEGRTDVVERLLAAGASPMSSCVVSTLQKDGQRWRYVRTPGYSALHLAVYYGHLEVVRRLIPQGGLRPHSARLSSSWPVEPLADLAIRRGHEAVLRALLEAGLEPTSFNVQTAISFGRRRCLSALLEWHAPFDDFHVQQSASKPEIRRLLDEYLDRWMTAAGPLDRTSQQTTTSPTSAPSLAVLEDPLSDTVQPSLSVDGAHAVVSSGQALQLWDTRSGEVLTKLTVPGARIVHGAFGADLVWAGQTRDAIVVRRGQWWNGGSEALRIPIESTQDLKRVLTSRRGHVWLLLFEGANARLVGLGESLAGIDKTVDLPLDDVRGAKISGTGRTIAVFGFRGQTPVLAVVDSVRGELLWRAETRVFHAGVVVLEDDSYVVATRAAHPRPAVEDARVHPGEAVVFERDSGEVQFTHQFTMNYNYGGEMAASPGAPIVVIPSVRNVRLTDARGVGRVEILSHREGRWRAESYPWPGPADGGTQGLAFDGAGRRLLIADDGELRLVDLARRSTTSLKGRAESPSWSKVALSGVGELVAPGAKLRLSLKDLTAEPLKHRQIFGESPVVAHPRTHRVFIGGEGSVLVLDEGLEPRVVRVSKRPPPAPDEPYAFNPLQAVYDLELSPDGETVIGPIDANRLFELSADELSVVRDRTIDANGIWMVEASRPRVVLGIERAERLGSVGPTIRLELRGDETCELEGHWYSYGGGHWTLNPDTGDLADPDRAGGVVVADVAGAKTSTLSAAVLARYSLDGRRLALASKGWVRFYDATTLDQLCEVQLPAATEMTEAEWSADGRWLLAGRVGASGLHFIEPTGCESVARLIVERNGEWIVLLRSGHYAASRYGAQLVGYRVGARFVPSLALDLELNRPDMVAARLGYASEEELDLLRDGVRRRFVQHGVDFDVDTPESDPRPTLSVSQEYLHREGVETLSVRARSGDRLHVVVDGVPLFGPAGVEMTRDEEEVVVPLARGRNPIHVGVVRRGRRSLPVVLSAPHFPSGMTREIYVASIGISDYDDDRLDLENAARDARDISRAFAEHASFSQVHTKVVTDRWVREETLDRIRDFFAQAAPNDALVLHVAGHGVVDQNLSYYFLRSSSRMDDLEATAWSFADLESVFDGASARRRLMLVDTCHSGDPSDLARGQLPAATRSRSIGYPVQELDDEVGRLKVMRRFLDLRGHSGVVVLAAASAGEYALDGAKGRNGVFTAAVIDGLSAGTQGLTVRGLVRHVEMDVRKQTGGRQFPILRQSNPLLDFRLK